MAKYTPWITRLDDEQSVIEEGGRSICRMDECPCTRQRAERNLIVAAPELVEALEAVEARLTAAARAFYVGGKRSALQAALDGWKYDAENARAAIDKARKED